MSLSRVPVQMYDLPLMMKLIFAVALAAWVNPA